MPLPYLPYSDNDLFNLVNLVMPAWLMLAFAPKLRATEYVAKSTILFFSLMYAALFVNSAMFGENAIQFEDFKTLGGVQSLLAQKEAALPAWVHYIAFDLAVGFMITKWNLSGGRGQVPLLIMPAVLFLTLMLGPCGVCLYCALRAVCYALGTGTGGRPKAS